LGGGELLQKKSINKKAVSHASEPHNTEVPTRQSIKSKREKKQMKSSSSITEKQKEHATTLTFYRKCVHRVSYEVTVQTNCRCNAPNKCHTGCQGVELASRCQNVKKASREQASRISIKEGMDEKELEQEPNSRDLYKVKSHQTTASNNYTTQ